MILALHDIGVRLVQRVAEHRQIVGTEIRVCFPVPLRVSIRTFDRDIERHELTSFGLLSILPARHFHSLTKPS
jgi:hypothetical protein